MVRRLCDLYESWETSNEVKLIILKGAGRAFCAGGDLRFFLQAWKTRRRTMPRSCVSQILA
ncbi:hypothetical protein KP509_04G043500 [Ceratopteris richardii]|uniref:3-hydroxyisobutyryl-CoA hydrolase n=1 Tax=Ceratopteris richardii TaxID=49495 RepID=A0A8T2UZZ6_CERRI|nr:hypothetical protein KP509_04G043500 [Ceratopteris richardii]